MKRLLWLALFLLIALSPAGDASAVPIPLPPANAVYLPLVHSRPCPAENPKVNVALAYRERGIPHDLLCIPAGNYYHDWQWRYIEDSLGVRLPMVWSGESLALFIAFKEQWEVLNERPATWYVLWANEPDRPDQADMTPAEVAALFLAIVSACPGCRLVGPMYSAADAGWEVAEVWRIVEEICGSPCPAVQKNRYAHSLHIYPRPDLNGGPAYRVQEFCLIVEGEEDCGIPIWITEFGYRSCYPTPYPIFKWWVTEALNHPNIEHVFIYTTFQQPQLTCYFLGALNWSAWELTGASSVSTIGRAWRDGVMEAGAGAAPPEFAPALGYP